MVPGDIRGHASEIWEFAESRATNLYLASVVSHYERDQIPSVHSRSISVNLILYTLRTSIAHQFAPCSELKTRQQEPVRRRLLRSQCATRPSCFLVTAAFSLTIRSLLKLMGPRLLCLSVTWTRVANLIRLVYVGNLSEICPPLTDWHSNYLVREGSHDTACTL